MMSTTAAAPIPTEEDGCSIVSSSSPSAGRRKALKEADSANQLRVLESYPLLKYFNISDRLLGHFQDAVYERRLDEAYVYGLRFANLGVSSLPQHPEWKSNTNSKGKKRLASQVEDVLCMMNVIKQRMDAEELMKIKTEMIARKEEEIQKVEAEERRKQQVDEVWQKEQQKRNALDKEREEFYAQQRSQRKKEIEQDNVTTKKKDTGTKKKEIEQSAMAKLFAMQAQMPSTDDHANQNEDKEKTSVVASTEKKIEEKSKSIRTKAKEGNKIKKWSTGEKKKSNPKTPTPSVDKDDSNRKATTTIVTERAAENIKQQYSHPQGMEQNQLSQQDNDEKPLTPTLIEKKETKINASSDSISVSSKSKHIVASTSKIDNGNSNKKKNQFLMTTPEKKIGEQCQRSQNENESLLGATTTTTTTTTASTTATIIAAQQTPQSKKEKATIDKLQRAISLQEDRLEEIEEKQIPSLLRAAKAFLKEKNKKEALKCVAHKKRLERQTDVIKAAVFNMETQMFMLESAFEDRHVKKALDEAQAAIAGYQQSIGDPNAIMVDLTNMSAALPELEVGDDTDEELMEELEEWLSPEEKKKSRQGMDDVVDDDDVSLLYMPTFLPTVPVNAPVMEKSSSSSVERVINDVMG
jgi:hypothetical protein